VQYGQIVPAAAASEPLTMYSDDHHQTAVQYSTLMRYDETAVDEHDLNSLVDTDQQQQTYLNTGVYANVA